MTKPLTNPTHARGIAFPCPVCRTRSRARTSEEETHLLRSLRFQCSNIDCGHTWLARLEFSHTLSPSAFGPVDKRAPVLRLPPRPLRGTEPPPDTPAAPSG